MTIQTNITNDTQPTPVAPPIAPSRLVAYTAEAILEDHGDDLKRLACTVDFLIDTIHASPIDWAGSNDGERARAAILAETIREDVARLQKGGQEAVEAVGTLIEMTIPEEERIT